MSRMWSTIAAMMRLQHVVQSGYSQQELVIAIEAYQFECRRFETALHALSTTMFLDADTH